MTGTRGIGEDMAPFLGVWPIITAGGARAHNGGGSLVLIRDLKSLTWTIIIAVDIKER